MRQFVITAWAFHMRRWARLLCVIAVGLLLPWYWPTTVHAQGPTLRFERLTVEDGLSQSKIHTIFQDRQGFMWFGTNEGLNRYDGYTFTVYKFDPDDPTSISDNVVYAIHEDSTGVLWVGTPNGLNRFNRDTQTWTRLKHDPANSHTIGNNHVSSIVEDASGTLWIGSKGSLNRYEREAQSFAAYPFSPAINSPVVVEQHQDDLWVGSAEGLFRLDRATQHFVPITFDRTDSQRDVYALQGANDGRLWIGTDNGLFHFDPQRQTATQYQHDRADAASIASNHILALHVDRSGLLWVGTQSGGLDTFEQATSSFNHHRNEPSNLNSLSGDSVSTIYEDHAGLLWIGTGGGGNGINIFNPATRAFHHYTQDHTRSQTFSTRTIATILEDRAGSLWFGGYDADGLNRFDRATQTIMTYHHDPRDPTSLPHNSIYEIYEDRSGTLWIGMLGGGVAAFDPATQRFTAYRNDPNQPRSLSNDVVPTVLEDRFGNLWVGTEAGLNRFDRTTQSFQSFFHDSADPQTLSNSEVSSIYEDASGVLWIGTWGGGINRYDRTSETFERYLHDPENLNSMSDNRVYVITGDQAGDLWIGTKIGLTRFSPQSGIFTRYTEKDGLPIAGVACVEVDAMGMIWLSTGRGMARFNPTTEQFHRYSARDGLQSDDFNGGACSESARGELFFGGNNGFNAFNPQEITSNPHAPQVVLTSISKLNEPVVLGKDPATLAELPLSHDDKVVTFEFAALDYTDTANNQYAYKLEGFDDDWVQAGTKRSATYTNLAGGEYVFRVKAANSDGVWNNEGTALRLVVSTPPWATWWAYGLYGVAVLGLVAGAVRYRTQAKANHALQAEIAERKRAEQEQQRLYHVAEGLREIVAVLNSDRSLAEVLQFITTQATRLLGAEAGQIYHLQSEDDGQEEIFRVEAGHGFRSNYVGVILKNVHLTVSYQAVQRRHPVAISDMTPALNQLLAQPSFGTGQQSLLQEVRQRFRSILVVPLIIKDEVYGTISVYDEAMRTFTEEEINLAVAFGRQSALAIENARLRQQVQQAAVREERGRLARELHDSVTQSLYSLALLAQGWRLAAQDEHLPGVAQQFARLTDIAHQALREMRLLIHQLRLPELEKEGLVGAVQRRLDAVERRSGIDARVVVDGELDLPVPIEEQIYRIIQEALNNALKHAAATTVTVAIRVIRSPHPALLDGAEPMLEIEISDNGQGFDPQAAASGFGIDSMHERAEQLGASLILRSAPAQGTTVSLHGTLKGSTL